MKNRIFSIKFLFSGAFSLLLIGVLFSSSYDTAVAQGAAARAAAKEAAKSKKAAAMTRKKAEVRARTAMNQMFDVIASGSGCVNCHAIGQLDGSRSTSTEMRQVARVVTHHPTEGYSEGNRGCSSCHISGWKTPPSSQNLSRMGSNRLCVALNTPTTSHPTVLSHLMYDSLINWSVSGANNPTTRLATGRSANRSSQNKREQWRTAVRNWVTSTDMNLTARQRCSIIR